MKGLAKLLLFEAETTNDKEIPKPWRPYAQKYRVYCRDDFNVDRIREFETIQQFKVNLRRSMSFSGEFVRTSTNKTSPDSGETNSYKSTTNVSFSSSSLPNTSQMKKDNTSVELQSDKIKERDYTSIFIPWGPQWYTQQILSHLIFRDKRQWYTHTHKRSNSSCQNLISSFNMTFDRERKRKSKSKNSDLYFVLYEQIYFVRFSMWLAKKKPRHILFTGIEGVIEGRSEWLKSKKREKETPSEKPTQHDPNNKNLKTPEQSIFSFTLSQICEKFQSPFIDFFGFDFLKFYHLKKQQIVLNCRIPLRMTLWMVR